MSRSRAFILAHGENALRFLIVLEMQDPLGRAGGFEGRGHCVVFDVR
jgi:hypothetical protein